MKECPAVFAQEAFELLGMNDMLKRGILPYPGSYMDQPKQLLRLLEYTAMEVRQQEMKMMGGLAPIMELLR